MAAFLGMTRRRLAQALHPTLAPPAAAAPATRRLSLLSNSPAAGIIAPPAAAAPATRRLSLLSNSPAAGIIAPPAAAAPATLHRLSLLSSPLLPRAPLRGGLPLLRASQVQQRAWQHTAAEYEEGLTKLEERLKKSRRTYNLLYSCAWWCFGILYIGLASSPLLNNALNEKRSRLTFEHEAAKKRAKELNDQVARYGDQLNSS